MTAPDVEATADAFGLLADPSRVEILAALWEAEESEVGYAALREATGLGDSGRFNYHLSKLTDHFVAKTGDGYRLRPAGLVVLNAIYAGSYVDAPTREGLDVEGECPTCGDDLVGLYDEGMFRVVCRECDRQLFVLSFPPRGVEQRSDDALLHAVSVHARAHVRRSQSGLCPFCGGPMGSSLVLDAESALPAEILVATPCENCGVANRASVGFAVLEHPAVAGFLEDCGVPRDAPPWRFDWCLRDDPVEVLDEDAPRVRVPVTAGNDGGDAVLYVTVGPDGDVVETERVDDGGTGTNA
ncbi:MAG: ArsR/SmtB family transcription factor [Halobacterium sp.]